MGEPNGGIASPQNPPAATQIKKLFNTYNKMEIPNYDSTNDPDKKIQTIIPFHAIRHISNVNMWK